MTFKKMFFWVVGMVFGACFRNARGCLRNPKPYQWHSGVMMLGHCLGSRMVMQSLLWLKELCGAEHHIVGGNCRISARSVGACVVALRMPSA